MPGHYSLSSRVTDLNTLGAQESAKNTYPAMGVAASDRDAFGKLRVSEAHTVFDSKHVFSNNEPLIWVTASSGAGDINYARNKAAVVLSTDGEGEAIRQTRAYFNYQSGKSQQILCTVSNMAGDAGVVKRVGYFDDDNGIFLEVSGSDTYMVQRLTTTGSTTDYRVAQSDWNLNTLPALDMTKAQIFTTDIEWLGVGRVRTGFIIDGFYIYVHEFNHANRKTGVWSQTPNLPIRYSLTSSAGSGSVDQICSTLISEGGRQNNGIKRTASRFLQGSVVGEAIEPVLSVRLQEDFKRGSVQFLELFIAGNTTTPYYWDVRVNPTITGGSAADWLPVSASLMEYDIARNGTIAPASGYIYASGYGTTDGGPQKYILRNNILLGGSIDGTERDELVVSVARVGGGTATFWASVDWLEVV